MTSQHSQLFSLHPRVVPLKTTATGDFFWHPTSTHVPSLRGWDKISKNRDQYGYLRNQILLQLCKTYFSSQASTGFRMRTIHIGNGGTYCGTWRIIGEIFKSGLKLQIHGPGEIRYSDGRRYDGIWNSDQLVLNTDPSPSTLAQPWFLELLLGIRNRVDGLYASSFLSHYFDLSILKEAHRLKTLSNQDASQEIMRSIERSPQEILYPYIANDYANNSSHAMGLGIKKEEENILIRVFNSGAGLDYHQSNGKYKETQWMVKIPYALFSESSLLTLLNTQEKPCDELYEKLMSFDQASVVKSKDPIWHTPQKGPSCSIEWMFAYLRNSVPQREYHELRLQFFEDCLSSLQKQASPDQKTMEILQAKVTKRQHKIASILHDEGECRAEIWW